MDVWNRLRTFFVRWVSGAANLDTCTDTRCTNQIAGKYALCNNSYPCVCSEDASGSSPFAAAFDCFLAAFSSDKWAETSDGFA